VVRRMWFLGRMQLAVLLVLSQAKICAQQEPTTADEVITKYAEAVGADRFSSITTFIERGDLYGNLMNFWQGAFASRQSQNAEHGTFESYFKNPNLRFSSTVTENNRIIALHGCNGKVAWHINAYLERREFKPKPGSQYECETGFEPIPYHFREANVKMRLVKKREVAGRMAWEIRVDRRNS